MLARLIGVVCLVVLSASPTLAATSLGAYASYIYSETRAYEASRCSGNNVCPDFQYFLGNSYTFNYGQSAAFGQTGAQAFAPPSTESIIYAGASPTALWMRNDARFSVQTLKFGPIWTDFLGTPTTTNPIFERLKAGETFRSGSPEAQEYYDWLASDSTPYTGPLFQVAGFRAGVEVATTLLSLDEMDWDVDAGFRHGGQGANPPGGRADTIFGGGYATSGFTKFTLGSEFVDLDRLFILPLDGYDPFIPNSSFFQRNFILTGGVWWDRTAQYHCAYKVGRGDYCASQGQLVRVGVTPFGVPLPSPGNTPAAVPLPASLWLALLGMASLWGLGARPRRRMAAQRICAV